MKKTLIFLLTLAMLLFNGNYISWQGTGNLSKDNTTQIWNYINTNFKKSWNQNPTRLSGDQTFVNFTISFSDHLNSIWDPAWNVVIIHNARKGTFDSVLYGYAFRDHWMWFNAYKMDDGNYVAFILWKDYNCITWFTYNYNSTGGSFQGSYTGSNKTAVSAAIANLYASGIPDQVWTVAKLYTEVLPTDSNIVSALGSGTVFTAIITQDLNAVFYGKFCAKNFVVDYVKAGTYLAANWGRALLLQMR